MTYILTLEVNPRDCALKPTKNQQKKGMTSDESLYPIIWLLNQESIISKDFRISLHFGIACDMISPPHPTPAPTQPKTINENLQ